MFSGHLKILNRLGFLNKKSVFQCPFHMFLFMGPLHSLRDTIIHWKKIEFERHKKVSIFAQSLISHYFRGPYVGCSWWAPARGCPHFSNFWKSPKNEASRAKKLKFNENKDFWKSCFLGPPSWVILDQRVFMIVIYHFEAKNSKKFFGPNATSGECTYNTGCPKKI